MKQITISKAALRILVTQLEAKGEGFSIKDLRLLDKTITALQVPMLEYNKTIDDKIAQAKAEIATDPLNQLFITAVNTKLNTELDKLTQTEGKVEAIVQLEDEQYNFSKSIIDASQGYLGRKEVRDLIFQIDDALQNATEVTN